MMNESMAFYKVKEDTLWDEAIIQQCCEFSLLISGKVWFLCGLYFWNWAIHSRWSFYDYDLLGNIAVLLDHSFTDKLNWLSHVFNSVFIVA